MVYKKIKEIYKSMKFNIMDLLNSYSINYDKINKTSNYIVSIKRLEYMYMKHYTNDELIELLK